MGDSTRSDRCGSTLLLVDIYFEEGFSLPRQRLLGFFARKRKYAFRISKI